MKRKQPRKRISLKSSSVTKRLDLQFDLRIGDGFPPQGELLPLEIEGVAQLLEFTCPLFADLHVVLVENRLERLDRLVPVVRFRVVASYMRGRNGK
jgi:hypothetical protein